MSGICGIWLRGSEPGRLAQAIGAMAPALGKGGTSETLVCGDSLALGVHRVTGFRGGVLEKRIGDRTVALAFHGNLYGPGAPGNALPAALLARYVSSGMEFVKDLHGEFAIAVWDSDGQRVFIATDRFRVHPMFYAGEGGAFAFASRMHALDRSPVPSHRTLDERAVMDVMSSSYIPTPETIYKEVRKLSPGHVLSCDARGVASNPYWDIDFREPSRASESALAKGVRDAFHEAVAVRHREDGGERIGAFLSGGIDSSTVTGVLTQVAGRPIRTFSIGFGEERFNEMSYARIAARAFQSEHHEYFVSPKDTADALPIVVEEFDEPFGNASAVPTYFCAKMARDHGVDFLYAGDGGDELFGGNDRYAFDRVFGYYRRIPAWLRKPLLTPAAHVLARTVPGPLFRRVRNYVDKASLPPVARMTAYALLNIIPTSEVAEPEFYRRLNGYNPVRALEYHYDRALGTTDLDRFLYLDLKLAIADNDLFKVNRMTERAGIAVRYPFLDDRLADAAVRVPAGLKMRGRNLRVFFKRAYRDLLPPEVIAKTKHGFGLPIAIWLRTDATLNGMMHDLVLGSRSLSRGYFRKRTLERLIEEHKTDTSSFYGTALWNLMVLELWHRRARDTRNA